MSKHDLIVTRGDGVPLPDQAAAVEEFKRQCLSSRSPVCSTDESRAAFEAWIKQPPYEHTCTRYGKNSAWPGHYRLYGTELAWQAWQAARQNME